jgi:hypothetical protein
MVLISGSIDDSAIMVQDSENFRTTSRQAGFVTRQDLPEVNKMILQTKK